MRFFSLLLLAATAIAAAHASSIETDPYTLSDGTVVDPTDPQATAAAAEERSTDSIYTTLSHNGPMGGMGGRQLRQ